MKVLVRQSSSEQSVHSLVQSVMADLLNDIYEERFLDCSYGFRPNRNAHQVVRYINQTIMTKKVNYVLEADIKGFFDNVNHEWMMTFLEHNIADKNFLRYVKRFLIAGILEGTERKESDKGTPQGGQISPVLANVYLHYVLDLWYDKVIRKQCKGEVYYVRYADDFLMLFQYENEAREVMEALKPRIYILQHAHTGRQVQTGRADEQEETESEETDRQEVAA